ncbi:hypothetical protein G6F37_010526 [Rhizopus arrhizus]|nr:hypothetical protein G6F38_011980 [Rhizopus arrhizus]KAG1153249.1 hypothetical protein G6F37_010526 [Rhizopus arrhizus]
MKKNNFITIFDNTPSAEFLYFSDSVTECCGWEPEELVGRACYEMYHPEDHKALRRFHFSNVANQKMSSMVSYKFLHKNGSWVPMDTIVSFCYDVLVTTNFVSGQDSFEHKMRVNSVDEVFICQPEGTLQLAGAWNDKQERMRMKMEDGQHWADLVYSNPIEKRFCLILNRFTDALTIVFTSKIIEDLTGVPSSYAIGRSVFEFIRERDIPALQTQLDMTIENDLVIRLRFDWLVDYEQQKYESLEAIASSTDDGVVMVIRLAPRFDLNQ